MSDFETIYRAVSLIPKGKVATYGQVAELAGIKSPRAVGNVLHNNKDPENIPCHRVVNSQGKVAGNFAFGGARGQVDKLLSEGVEVKNNRVDLGKYPFHSE